MTAVAGSSSQPSPLYPHVADNPDDGEGVRLCSAVYLKPHGVALSRRSFYCILSPWKLQRHISIMFVHIFTLDIQRER